MFALTNQPAKILNHNPSPEQHGDELKLAGVIRLQVTCSAAVLDAFDTQLQGFLFRPRQAGDAAVQVNIEGGPAAVSRRLPQLDPLTWNEKFPGFRLTIVKGMGLQEPLVLPMRTLSKFEIEAVDGGLAKISFNAGGTYDSTLVSGELDGQQRREVEITLEPPQPDAVAEAQQDLPLKGAAAQKSVLVAGIELIDIKGGSLTAAKVALAGDADHTVGQWAYRPSLDEIAIALHEATGASVEFAPACRKAYERAAA
jgi:hypothetical protein